MEQPGGSVLPGKKEEDCKQRRVAELPDSFRAKTHFPLDREATA